MENMMKPNVRMYRKKHRKETNDRAYLDSLLNWNGM
jgi:hypothetical protein